MKVLRYLGMGMAWLLYLWLCGITAALIVDVPSVVLAGRPGSWGLGVLVWLILVILGVARWRDYKAAKGQAPRA
jgi:hypothetical protein